MVRAVLKLFIVASLLLTWTVSSTAAQAPDGTMKITSRRVAEGIGLSWGEGILTYKGQTYPFTFQANGLFRDIDAGITVAGGGSGAAMKNQNGVVMNVVATTQGLTFNLVSTG